MSDFDHFHGAATSGGVPGGCKYFSARASPQVGPDGSKVRNKKILTSPDTPNPSYVQLSPSQNAIYPPVVKRGSSFNLILVFLKTSQNAMMLVTFLNPFTHFFETENNFGLVQPVACSVTTFSVHFHTWESHWCQKNKNSSFTAWPLFSPLIAQMKVRI